jgi:hypothetical protein
MHSLSPRRAGDESHIVGDFCRADGIQPNAYAHMRTCMNIYIWPCGPLR